MKEFLDRIPAQGKTNRKKITYSDSTEEYVIIENADDPETGEEGTGINRANLMAMQGFQDNSITISESGNVTTIIETNGNGETFTTEITENANGSFDIVETLVGDKTIIKTTSINAEGTEITEEIVNELV